MDDDVLDSSACEGFGKQRMRWTPQLRTCFEDAVNLLGGADRATPKGILKAMSVPGLTMAHVKSYLQKYRMSKFIPEACVEGQLESKNLSDIFPNFCITSAKQINEALQLHLKEQRSLSSQSETQMRLRAKIELQALYLDMIAEEMGGGSKNDPHILDKNTNSHEHLIGTGRLGDDVEQESNKQRILRRQAKPSVFLPDFLPSKRLKADSSI